MKISVARWLTLISFAALAAVVVVWVMQLEQRQQLAAFLIGTVPLLPWVRGVLHGRLKPHVGLALTALLYLTHGSVEGFANGNPLGWIEAAIALTLIISASMYVRWKASST
ncbi:MAG: DUF2069 domain-containing protein [Pseudomonadota bacterium]